jgi:hypothetical protein
MACFDVTQGFSQRRPSEEYAGKNKRGREG